MMQSQTIELPIGPRPSALRIQDYLGALNRFWLVPLAYAVVYLYLRLRCENLKEVQRLFKNLVLARKERGRPVILCANHLTMIDSLILFVFLRPMTSYLRSWNALPWSVPESTNFRRQPLVHAITYLAKSIYVERNGSPDSKALTMASIRHVLTQGDVISIFPEGGRSRSGRVDVTNCVYGVGDLVQDFPRCQVVCVYSRGRYQKGYSFFPVPGDRYRLSLCELHPTTALTGRRGARDITLQIMNRLCAMEEDYFRDR